MFGAPARPVARAWHARKSRPRLTHTVRHSFAHHPHAMLRRQRVANVVDVNSLFGFTAERVVIALDPGAVGVKALWGVELLPLLLQIVQS